MIHAIQSKQEQWCSSHYLKKITDSTADQYW